MPKNQFISILFKRNLLNFLTFWLFLFSGLMGALLLWANLHAQSNEGYSLINWNKFGEIYIEFWLILLTLVFQGLFLFIYFLKWALQAFQNTQHLPKEEDSYD